MRNPIKLCSHRKWQKVVRKMKSNCRNATEVQGKQAAYTARIRHMPRSLTGWGGARSWSGAPSQACTPGYSVSRARDAFNVGKRGELNDL